jgi:hypothetical protein
MTDQTCNVHCCSGWAPCVRRGGRGFEYTPRRNLPFWTVLTTVNVGFLAKIEKNSMQQTVFKLET